MEHTPVNTVRELVKFNEDNKDKELPAGITLSKCFMRRSLTIDHILEAPNQDVLLFALETEPWTEEQTATTLAAGQRYAGPEGIERVLRENNLDVILGPADSWLTNFADVAGQHAWTPEEQFEY